MNSAYVYLWRTKATKTVFYVGKGTGKRAQDFFTSTRSEVLKALIRSIGVKNIDVLILKNNLTEEEALKQEKFYIDLFGKEHEGGRLLNKNNGGAGSRKRQLE